MKKRLHTAAAAFGYENGMPFGTDCPGALGNILRARRIPEFTSEFGDNRCIRRSHLPNRMGDVSGHDLAPMLARFTCRRLGGNFNPPPFVFSPSLTLVYIVWVSLPRASAFAADGATGHRDPPDRSGDLPGIAPPVLNHASSVAIGRVERFFSSLVT
jgi:hypothetical protein